MKKLINWLKKWWNKLVGKNANKEDDMSYGIKIGSRIITNFPNPRTSTYGLIGNGRELDLNQLFKAVYVGKYTNPKSEWDTYDNNSDVVKLTDKSYIAIERGYFSYNETGEMLKYNLVKPITNELYGIGLNGLSIGEFDVITKQVTVGVSKAIRVPGRWEIDLKIPVTNMFFKYNDLLRLVENVTGADEREIAVVNGVLKAYGPFETLKIVNPFTFTAYQILT
ncbi:hypothetical protein SAMN05660772_02872 [Pasteurella testudinis DSM 23072]|uniref:Uncharacterized protein n=1 Tax=Pasteurella testudinis DSM 23072 TaxID=1122938 RepID=A0A1W1V7Q7_9PAST|nr:hypothetical protein [Pasteurella testudinis]SMB89372.1 hypothetical protein SAMN05660772_02872 [Pasteurella testudinis DSM 23072]SUB51648.1 Uncharacterised protein [Pasteurella testudinis]